MCELVDSEMTKVMTCTSTKEIWDKLKSIHKGDVKIKESKLQTHRAKFEGLKMNGDESIEYMHRVSEIVNAIWGLGDKIEDFVIMKKVLHSLLEKYNSKFFPIEEPKDMNTSSMDELHGSLTAYEMRIAKEKPSNKEVAFKAKQKAKEKPKPDSDKDSNALKAHFIRKLKKGGKGKYKGKLPFKCFKCGHVGHFVIKCPYGKKDKEDEDSHKEKCNWKRNHTSRVTTTKDKASCLSMQACQMIALKMNHFDEALFMVVEEREPKTKHDSYDDENKGECEVVVDLEAELVAALEEVYAKRRNHKKNSKNLTQVEKMVVDLKVQVEECQKMTEDLETQLCTKFEYCNELEAMVATLTHELDEKNQKIETYHKFENGSTKLNELINSQRSTNIKFSLGFSKGETSKAPTLGKNEVPHIKFGPGFVKTKAPKVPKKEEKEVT